MQRYWFVVSLKQEGMTLRNISALTGKPYSTFNSFYKRFTIRNSLFPDKKKSGPTISIELKRKISIIQTRKISHFLSRIRRQLILIGIKVCKTKIHNYRKLLGFKKRKLPIPYLMPRHIEERKRCINSLLPDY